MAFDLSFYDIFVPQKVPFSKISDNVIAYDLWLTSSLPIKNTDFNFLICYADVQVLAQQNSVTNFSTTGNFCFYHLVVHATERMYSCDCFIDHFTNQINDRFLDNFSMLQYN